MKFVDTLKRSSRNLRHSKVRTLLTALAIAVGGFTLSITLAAAAGARSYTDKLVKANFDPHSVFVAKDKAFFGDGSNKPREYSTDLASTFGTLLKQFDQADIAKIKQMPHVTQVIANYDLNAQFITRNTPGAKRYTGALTVYDNAQKPEIKAGKAPQTLGDNETLLADDYLSVLKFSSAEDAVGKQVVLQVRQLAGGATQQQMLTVVGVTTKSSLSLGFVNPGLYINETQAASLNSFINGGTPLAGKVPTVVVRGDGASPQDLKQQMQKAGYEARTAQDLQQLINQVISVLQGVIVVFGLITLIASFFGVVNTQYISVLERTREIGLMKALGMSRRAVSRLFMVEATWIGFIGAALGSGLAIGVGIALNPWLTKTLNFGNERLLIFKPLQIIGLIVFLMFVTTVAGLLPARKAAKLDPIEALRTE